MEGYKGDEYEALVASDGSRKDKERALRDPGPGKGFTRPLETGGQVQRHSHTSTPIGGKALEAKDAVIRKATIRI